MLIRAKSLLRDSDVTDHGLWLDRRRFLALGAAGLGMATARSALAAPLSGLIQSPYRVDEAPTSRKDVTTYNNFYEFGTDKSDPAQMAPSFFGKPPKPWTIAVSG